MNVAHLSCGVEGGADIAAVRIHRLLLRAGVNSKFYHLGHPSPDNTFKKFNENASIVNIFKSRVRIYENKLLYGNIKPDTEVFTNPWGNFPLTFDDLNFPDVDIITLHWIAAFFDLEKFLSSVPKRVRFVWAFHDLNPFTGGCHYTAGCRKFETECEKCPQLFNTGLIDLAKKNFYIKNSAYRKYLDNRLHIIADSVWVGEESKRSKLLGGAPTTAINYPIETDVFRVLDKAEVRKSLGLDADRPFLLFGSGALNNLRKGMDLLVEALRLLTASGLSTKFQVVTFGSGNLSEQIPGVDIRSFGKVQVPEFLALLYNAADFFIMPSKEEALGQTAMESLCCGTPVVAFPAGGLLDTVDNSNGVLAGSIDAPGLARAIQEALSRKFDRNSISANAHARYNFDVKQREYLKVYESL